MNDSTLAIAKRDGKHATVTPEERDQLAAQVDGPLLHEGEKGWDEAVLIWNGMAAEDARARRPADLGARRRRCSRVCSRPRAAAQHQGRRPQHRRHGDRRAAA